MVVVGWGVFSSGSIVLMQISGKAFGHGWQNWTGRNFSDTTIAQEAHMTKPEQIAVRAREISRAKTVLLREVVSSRLSDGTASCNQSTRYQPINEKSK